METPIETITRGDLTAKIYQDADPQSPREWDNLGQMVCFHRRYDLGDKHDLSMEDVQALTHRKDVVWLPLYLYDHSGLRMSTGSFRAYDPGEWDSGQVGIIYVTYERLRKEYSKKLITKKTIKLALEVLEGEVKTYDQYLSGDVYGYVLENMTGDHLDSCWGFFGFEHVKAEAAGVLEWWIKELVKRETEARCDMAL